MYTVTLRVPHTANSLRLQIASLKGVHAALRCSTDYLVQHAEWRGWCVAGCYSNDPTVMPLPNVRVSPVLPQSLATFIDSL